MRAPPIVLASCEVERGGSEHSLRDVERHSGRNPRISARCLCQIFSRNTVSIQRRNRGVVGGDVDSSSRWCERSCGANCAACPWVSRIGPGSSDSESTSSVQLDDHFGARAGSGGISRCSVASDARGGSFSTRPEPQAEPDWGGIRPVSGWRSRWHAAGSHVVRVASSLSRIRAAAVGKTIVGSGIGNGGGRLVPSSCDAGFALGRGRDGNKAFSAVVLTSGIALVARHRRPRGDVCIYRRDDSVTLGDGRSRTPGESGFGRFAGRVRRSAVGHLGLRLVRRLGARDSTASTLRISNISLACSPGRWWQHRRVGHNVAIRLFLVCNCGAPHDIGDSSPGSPGEVEMRFDSASAPSGCVDASSGRVAQR